jgi:beta-phosphoglucomutase-like phosphatase (HAD superfamily)
MCSRAIFSPSKLVDTVPQHLRSFAEALAQAGFEVPYETLQPYSGLDGNQTLQILGPKLGDRLRQEILHAHARIFETKYLSGVKAFPRDEDFETLTERGGRIALATECKGPEA